MEESCIRFDDMKRSAESDPTPHPEKKPKLGTDVADGGDVEKGDEESFYSFLPKSYEDISDPEDFGLDGTSNYDYDKWKKYYSQIYESEGFDIDDEVYPGLCPMAQFRPVPEFKNFPEEVKIAESLAKSALETYNTENNTKFKLVEVEKQVINYLFNYLTFKAVAPDADVPPTTFQAKVFHRMKNETEVDFCRIKE